MLRGENIEIASAAQFIHALQKHEIAHRSPIQAVGGAKAGKQNHRSGVGGFGASKANSQQFDKIRWIRIRPVPFVTKIGFVPDLEEAHVATVAPYDRRDIIAVIGVIVGRPGRAWVLLAGGDPQRFLGQVLSRPRRRTIQPHDQFEISRSRRRHNPIIFRPSRNRVGFVGRAIAVVIVAEIAEIALAVNLKIFPRKLHPNPAKTRRLRGIEGARNHVGLLEMQRRQIHAALWYVRPGNRLRRCCPGDAALLFVGEPPQARPAKQQKPSGKEPEGSV